MLDKMMFGQVALDMKLVNDDQLAECLEIQKQLQNMGISKPIGEILLEKKYLSGVEVLEILNSMAQEASSSAIQGYEIVRKLGQGGMGEVYKAREKSTGKVVAVKIIDPEGADKESLKRFAREAANASKLNHVNIVRALDVGESYGYHYFVMEYVDGNTVKEMLEQKGQLDEADAISVGIQMARALTEAWNFQIVHRDVKPSNIMMTADGTAKLCDFGLAKQTSREGDAEVTEVTQVGVVMGTPYYLSPEQARSEELDIRSDLYSLGVTLYHMLTGTVPFTGESVAVIMYKHIFMDPPNMRKKNFMLSQQICEVVSKSLAKKREDRYQTPVEFEAALESVLTGLQPGKKTTGTDRGETALRAPWLPAAVGAAILLLAFTAAYFRGSAAQMPVPQVRLPAAMLGDLPKRLSGDELQQWQELQLQKKKLEADGQLGTVASLFGERYLQPCSMDLKTLLLSEFDVFTQRAYERMKSLREQAKDKSPNELPTLLAEIQALELDRLIETTRLLDARFAAELKAESTPR